MNRFDAYLYLLGHPERFGDSQEVYKSVEEFLPMFVKLLTDAEGKHFHERIPHKFEESILAIAKVCFFYGTKIQEVMDDPNTNTGG